MQLKTTYFADFNVVTDIENPVLDNNTGMTYNGCFLPNRGLYRSGAERGVIYTSTADDVISTVAGYIGLRIVLPDAITNGVYAPLVGTNNRYILWGVNMDVQGNVVHGMGAYLSANGIEFVINNFHYCQKFRPG